MADTQPHEEYLVLRMSLSRKWTPMDDAPNVAPLHGMATDWTLERVGKLTVLSPVYDKFGRHVKRPGTHSIEWLCRCECGREETRCSAELARSIKRERVAMCKECRKHFSRKTDGLQRDSSI